MFGPKELDLRNTYDPDLQDIQVSAVTTYDQANDFYETAIDKLKKIEDRFKSGEVLKEGEIYTKANTIASILAYSCELYLKALFIHEHNIPSHQVDELWNEVKNGDFKTDLKGNLVYKTPAGAITFVKYDDQGNPIKDADGKIIYFDKDNNTYNENSRGSKIKRNGHQLDRLIEMLSSGSRLLLETRMLKIPMKTTEENQSISILDMLEEKGVLSQENQISPEQYVGLIEQHKKTFEETRYAGQMKHDISVEFLFHLATQIKAVVQYKIEPTNDQNFTVTKEEADQLADQLPEEIKQMALSHKHLMSNDLIKLIANDEEIKNKIKLLFSNQYITPPENISPMIFYKIIKLMDFNEISYLSYLFFMFQNYDELNSVVFESSTEKYFKKIFETVKMFKIIDIESTEVIELLVQIKEIFGERISIDNKSIEKLIKRLIKDINYNKYIDKDINYNKYIDKDNINNINNIKYK